MGVVVEERDLGWNDFKKQMKKLSGSYVDIGIFGNEGDPSTNLAARAAVMEYSSSRWKEKTERPFMRKTIDENVKEIGDFIDNGFGKIIEGRSNSLKLLKGIGVQVTGLTKQTITEGKFKPLKPSTIRKKGSSRPLIDTGDMRSSIEYEETLK